MSRPVPAASAIHVHIRRLVIDGGAPGSPAAADDLSAQLRAALAPLQGQQAPAQCPGTWAAPAATEVVERVREALPGGDRS
ncbi:hypothetical protein [Dyella ginsengisoli]|uniref:hypothetical protein n=1 Tax=Dyella ginsengisoli TaxID=363848 RepID=UPI00037A6561|nr:hypothetical protein [Dyella ginsengisoli]